MTARKKISVTAFGAVPDRKPTKVPLEDLTLAIRVNEGMARELNEAKVNLDEAEQELGAAEQKLADMTAERDRRMPWYTLPIAAIVWIGLFIALFVLKAVEVDEALVKQRETLREAWQQSANMHDAGYFDERSGVWHWGSVRGRVCYNETGQSVPECIEVKDGLELKQAEDGAVSLAKRPPPQVVSQNLDGFYGTTMESSYSTMCVTDTGSNYVECGVSDTPDGPP